MRRRVERRVPSKWAITSLPVADAVEGMRTDPEYMATWLCESKTKAQALHRTLGVAARHHGVRVTGVIGPVVMSDELFWMLFARRDHDGLS